MDTLIWFLCGLGAAMMVGFGMFGIIGKKFISNNEAMILVVLFLCGPAGFVIACIAAIGRIMIEVNSQPHTPLLDWRVPSRAVECPRCAWNSNAHPTGANTCPTCHETLLSQ